MAPIRVTSKDGITAVWGGPREAHSLTTPGGGAVPSAGSESSATPRAGWMRTAGRFVRNAAIGMLLLTAVPFVVASTSGDALWSEYRGTRDKLAEAERLRPFMSPRDPAITPMQAGVAFRVLESPQEKTGSRASEFPLRDVAAPAERVWERELTPTMFNGMMAPGFQGSSTVRFIRTSAQLISRSHDTFSAEELAYLRAVAESPVWRDFDRVASAPQVDMIGGKFVLPFRDDAFALGMPTMRYADTKLLANAGVMRAAYYAATGQPERAEAALRAVVSFGFAMIDNGNTLLDALIGRAVVDIGHYGLLQWYELSHDARAAALAAPFPKAQRTRGSIGRPEIDVEAVRARLLADATNPRAPRTLRLESLRQLSFSTCGSARGMLFGQSADVDAAFDDARKTLARYPSERAFIDLLYEAPARVPEGIIARSLSDRLIVGAATVTGMLLDNPRVASCTRILRSFD
jgi:hypothetical protein